MSKYAIIIGAGPAGLTAAYEILKRNQGMKPIIIEKEDFVGGISRTAEHNGNRMDIGGHRFFTKIEEVKNIWTELMPLQGKPSIDDVILEIKKPLAENGPDPEKEDQVFLIRSRISRILYLRKFFDYPISLKMQTFTNLGIKNTFAGGISYIKSQVIKRNEKSLEDFMINRFGTQLYKMFFKEYTYKVWGRYPAEISADWGAQRIKGLSLSKAVLFMLKKPFMKKELSQNKVETSLIELFMYPKKGPGQFWQSMADEIIASGGEILFQSKISSIKIKDEKIESVMIMDGTAKRELRADYLISSMPIFELTDCLETEVPDHIKEIASNLPYRDFITVGLLVDKLKISNRSKIHTVGDIVPDCWIYVQEPDVKMGRVQIFNNWSPYMVKDFQNTVWIGLEYFCQENDEMWNQTDKEFIDFAVGEAVRIGLIEEGSVKDSVRIKVEKAYPAYFGMYDKFDAVKDYLNRFENLYCIGRNGQHRYNNMDHSMLTAIKAVDAIFSGEINKESIWNVNTESDYHEEKSGSKGE